MNLKNNCVLLTAVLVMAIGKVAAHSSTSTELLNASYDSTRELYDQYDKLFSNHWNAKTGKNLIIHQSHGGSGAQARAVIDGLDADVVTLAVAYDIDIIADKSKLLPFNWQQKLPNNSCPYTSTIVFLVRSGNPKHIHDWSDLIRPNVQVITPNPKTSGGARWNFLAAWGYALKKNNGKESAAIQFIHKLYKNVPILDTGSRGSTTTFAQRNIGDVLLAWENEALLVVDKFGKDTFEIVLPSVSILVEPPVAVLEKNTNKKGTTQVAEEYLTYLYTTEAQEIIAGNGYRPSNKSIAKKYDAKFPKLPMFTINYFGGWKNVQKTYFDEGGMFDQIYVK